ncbi:hypothetical protein T05_2410 [Trichinella murrelli]|uniref:Uncharacterized protein n=1 Tax=Trichinella murrelli TaxID=144512 RepID=A0A0V0SZP3_9BILA|nr:hypothetical protein T05_2410 [Trichinella murrelli]
MTLRLLYTSSLTGLLTVFIAKVTYLPNCLMEMSVTGILQSHNRTPKCLSLLKSCIRLFQHDIGKLLLAREYTFILPPLILSEWQ